MLTIQQIAEKGKGARKQKIDLRDYRAEVILGAVQLPTEFSVRDKISKVKDQGSSESCVANSFAYYVEALNKTETGQTTEMSARDVYSSTFLKGGGSYLRDAADKVCNSGVVPEAKAPSYQNGNPPSEQFMESRDGITPEEVEEGKTYLAKKYITWNNKNWEAYKNAIYQGQGACGGAMMSNATWRNAILEVPEKSQAIYGHAVFFTGFKVINGKEYLEFCNSWGQDWSNQQGFGYMPREYVEAGLVFNPITLIDLSNNYYTTAKKTISILQNLISLYQQLINKIKAGISNLTK